MSIQTSAPRGADKYSLIANEMRRRIACGEFLPGSQLPHRTELEESFQVSKVTLQRVMNLLIDEGFIDATRRKGSFVSTRPPHLSRYALVFQGTPAREQSWTRFWMALVNEANWHERWNDSSLPIFYGVDGRSETEDSRKLATEAEEHRLAGIIYVTDPRRRDLSHVILPHLEIPRVVVQGAPEDGTACVTIDYRSFLVKALQFLHGRGRRRVAFVCPPDFAEGMGNFMQQQAQACGMETYPYWIQGIGLEMPFAARNCVHLLLNPAQTVRPDALIITDDNLTEAATSGLLAAGVNVPAEIEVVSHANFPWKTPCVVETWRLGYDVRSLLKACLQSIDAQRSGVDFQERVAMSALFESELPA